MLALQAELRVGRVTPVLDRAAASSRSPGGRTSASRRSSTGSWGRRWRSSPTSRRPRGARSAASPRATTGSSCWSTCPGVQRPRDPLTERMQRRMERELADSDAALFVLNGEPGDRPGRPLHRRRARAAPRAGRHRGQQGRPRSSRAETLAALQAAAELDLGDDIFPISARGRAAWRRSSSTCRRCCPRARSCTRPRRHRPVREGAARRAGPRAGAAPHPRGAAARRRGRGRGDRGARATA